MFGSAKVRPPGGAQIALRFPKVGAPGPLPPKQWHIDGMNVERNNGPGTFSLLCGVALSNWTLPYMGNFTVFPNTHHHLGQRLQVMDRQEFNKLQASNEKDRFDNGLMVSAECGDVILCHPFLAHRV